MNKSKLKTYAPQARKDFIAAVTARANLLGLSEAGGNLEVAPGERKGDIAIIAGREWPVKLYEQRERLIKHMNTVGFSQAVEAVAYTWFNRFAALRYMEIHDYLDHGHRVLSNREGGMPEILNHATELDLPGLNKDKAIELKLAGNKDGDLYKMLLVAQCNALSIAMPFLFEHIDDETELLLPDNLLRTDSIIAKLEEAIPEEDWQEVEIIGWLYQFYISEKKDEVIGKVVKSEDIPAATQLFTPNWIVQYLVQNSVGRLWLMANPASTLKNQWPYYIEPAEQTPDVGAALAAITQARMDEDGGSLNPESITMLDPACGSGHILVVGYELFKAIYLERGYQLRAIPRLILEKNLYGLDIDDRAAQMAGFALLMKARADDRRLFDNPPKLNVLALQESKGLNADEIAQALNTVRAEHVEAHHIRSLIDTFAHAKTFGSLIQIQPELNAQLATVDDWLQQIIQKGDLYAQAAAQDLLPLVRQALVLGRQFDAVVANPPYMGGKGMNTVLKDYAKATFPDGKSDLFAMFVLRCSEFASKSGRIGLMTPFVWMFLGSYEAIRRLLTEKKSLTSLVQPQYHTFFESAAVPICAFIVDNSGLESNGNYFDLTAEYGAEVQPVRLLAAINDSNLSYRFQVDCHEFAKIPTSPIAYWTSRKMRDAVHESKSVGEYAVTRQGLITGNNHLFLRLWHEVPSSRIGFSVGSRHESIASGKRWFPCVKGGAFRKWYGNNDFVVDWENDGIRIRSYTDENGHLLSRPQNLDYYFREGMSWSTLTIGTFSMRWCPPGSVFESKGSMCFANDQSHGMYLLAFFNTKLVNAFLRASSPTLDYHEGPVARLAFRLCNFESVTALAKEAVNISKSDWNSFESSQEFLALPFCCSNNSQQHLSNSWLEWKEFNGEQIHRLKVVEEEINRLFIEAYDLQDELSPEVPEDKITLARADREKDCRRLISYAIGCMMGRYSLDEPGLIYAHADNVGFDATRYPTFPADTDGIVPLTDELWFEDDAANRIREFLRSVWGAETLEENMTWLAESLSKKGNETQDETVRRYLSGSFFKDHLQTYKKRPIYWLFSSGKQGAFQALVYLHRYHEGTLARMRSEYVVPLTGKIQSRIEMLTKDAEAATSTAAARNKLNKEVEGLRKKHVELLTYDEKLRHYADMRIQLDLDDGVKVNYGKFGDLLAEVKAVTGGASDD